MTFMILISVLHLVSPQVTPADSCEYLGATVRPIPLLLFVTENFDFKSSKSATSKTSKTTDIKPTNNNDPTNAAGLPPDLPAATDADAAGAGLMAGVPGFGGR
jgi:hypothetical protein